MTESKPASTTTHDSKVRPRVSRPIKIFVVAIIVIAILIWAGFWLAHRLSHVSSDDARVAAHVITVSSRLAGRVSTFDLKRGDHLDKGETVAKLNSKPDRLELHRLQARVAAAMAQLDTAQSKLRLAKQQIGGGVDQSQSKLAADKAKRDAAKAELTRAQDQAARAQRLYKAGGATKQKRNNTRYAARARHAEYQAAKKQVAFDKIALANARTGLLSQPTMNLTNPAVQKNRIKTLRDKLAAARAALDHQQNRIDDLRVASPIAGVVDKRFINPAEYVSAGQPIVMMHAPGKVWISAKIKETKVHSLKPGQHVSIHVDARPNAHYTGTIKVIGQAATDQFALLPPPNPSGNFTKITQRIPVRIHIDHGSKKNLSPGMMVEVDIDVSGDTGPDSTQS